MRFNVFVIILLSIIELSAQNISGRVSNKDGEPIAYANVVLLTTDSVYIDGTITSDKGEFNFYDECPFTGRLKISCIGYETLCMPVYNNNVGDVRMTYKENMLSEVVVTPPLYTMKGTGLIVSIQNSALSHMNDISKMLEFIPGVQYNNDGLYVFGKGKPLVYLNGRVLSDMSELERLKSSDIATVEIITNPGSKYSASHQSIVKIKTIRKKGDGLSLNMRSYFQLAHSTRFGETCQANYRSNKFDVFGYLNYLHANDYETEVNRYDIISENPFNLSSSQKKYIGRNIYTGKIGFDYYFTSRQNIGAYYSYTYNDYEAKNHEKVSVIENEATTDSQTYESRNGYSNPTHRINAYYSGNIGSIDVNFNNDLFLSDNRQNQEVIGYSGIYGEQLVTNANMLKNKLFASDLSLGYRKGKSTWEFGTLYNNINRVNHYDSKGGIELAEDQKIQENKWAVYANYNLTLNNWDIDAGLRYELYRYDYYKDGSHIDNQSKTYRNVYPSMSISRPFGNVNVCLSYSAKSQKPHYNALDGNIQYVSRNLYRSGNPLLKPCDIHDLQLVSLYNGLTVSVDYIRMKNPLYFTYRFYDGDHNIILASYGNYPKVNIGQAQVSYSKKIRFWKPTFTAECLLSDYKFEQSGKIYKQDKPLFTINLNHAFIFPRNWYFYLYTRYQSSGCNEQGLKLDHRSRISLYVMKRWKNLSVDVLLNDIMHSFKDSYSAISQACLFHTSGYFDTQNVQINIRYSFNATRSKYKGSDAAQEEFNRM